MKFRWNSDTVSKALESLPHVVGVRVLGSGGDYDTEMVKVYVLDSDDWLLVRGFVTNESGIGNAYETTVDMIEITDGLQSDTALSSRNINTAMAYVEARQWFIDQGAEVVQSMDQHF